MKDSAIEWTNHTFNPWRGCTKVSAGCANCYAETLSGRNPGTLGVWGPNGTRVVASEAMWREPVKWNRDAEKAGERHRVFCASLADVFEDWQGPMVNAAGERLFNDDHGGVETTMQNVRDRLFRLIDATPHLDWLILTKRPENIARMMPVYLCETCRDNGHWSKSGTRGFVFCKDSPACIRPNVWLGTSVENQSAADDRIPHLLKVPAAVRFLSMEPLLGSVDLWAAMHPVLGKGNRGAMQMSIRNGIDWVIVGGESGPGARPMELGWAESIVDQCSSAGVACFVKQLGGVRDKRGDITKFPACLQVREFPPVPAGTHTGEGVK